MCKCSGAEPYVRRQYSQCKRLEELAKEYRYRVREVEDQFTQSYITEPEFERILQAITDEYMVWTKKLVREEEVIL